MATNQHAAPFTSPSQPPSSNPPAPKKSLLKRPWLWLLVVLVVIVTIIATTSKNSASGPGSPGDTTTRTSPSAQTTESSATSPATTTSAPSATAKPTVSNGDHIVGPDFPAGVYRAEVQPGFISLCTVSQEDNGKYLDVRNAGEGSVIFTVADKPGSVVSFSGCQNIGLAANMIRSNPDPVTNGYWLVGDEVVPGTYQCTVDTSSAVSLGTVTQINAKGSIMDIRNATEGNVVFTVKASAGSVVAFSGCSAVTKVK